MFFLHELERTIILHPSFFGPKIPEYLIQQLLNDVEGKFMGSYYIIAVMDTFDISDGRVLPGSAHAEYTIHFKAIVWKPFKGEILDGIVNSVVESGFFLDIGPLNVFVAKTMIPSEIKFDGNATPPQWTDNQDQVIEKGSHIRIKVKGIRGEVNEMFAIATIKEVATIWDFYKSIVPHG